MLEASVIIFSKDRPAQLDLLLRSIARFTAAPELRVTVLFTASTSEAELGYRRTMADHSARMHFHEERDFSTDVIALVEACHPLMMFLVDDDVLLHRFSLDLPEVRTLLLDDDVACLSLRMGPQIRQCYTKNIQTPPPDFLPGRRWRWRGLAGDWGYPMSLDGHLFRTADLAPLLRSSRFSEPNGLENALSARPVDRPLMTCFARSRLVNVPHNRVQSVFPNRSMENDPGALTAQYLGGGHLDLDRVIASHSSTAVHQEMELVFQEKDPEHHHDNAHDSTQTNPVPPAAGRCSPIAPESAPAARPGMTQPRES